MPYIGKSPSFGVRNRFVYVASSGDTSVSGADANGATLTFTDGAYVDVYLNGVLLKPTTDYNTSTANTIAGLSALNTSDEVTVVVYDVFAVADTVSATSGGTFSGGITINDGTTITTADNTNTLTLISTDADNDVGPVLNFYRNSASPADSDSIGHMEFNGQNDAGEVVRYARIRGRIDDVTDGTEDSKLIFETITAGATQENVRFEPNSIVFNEGGAAVDFRIEGDTNANLFIVDGSEDDIGMGLTPSFTNGNGVHLADDFKIGFGAGGNSRPDFQLGYSSSADELGLACGFGADTADIFFSTGGTLGFNVSGGSTCILFEDADNSSATVMTMVNAAYNGGTNKIATFNTTKLSLDPQNSESLLLGTDGSLRLQHVYDDTTSNSANMYIHSDGTHQVLRSTSSERYKKDIETLEDKYADAVLGLRPVWYKSKCEADNADHSHWGLIAEEVAKVDPRLVTFRNEITTSNNDPDTLETIIKTTKLDEPQAESVQYDRFVPHLINICKRQEDKITALEAKVKALEEA